jgi:hypothetical protein
MKRSQLLSSTAAIVTAFALLTSDAWAQNGQSPRFEAGVTVPGVVPHSKRPGVYLVSFNTPIGLPGVSLTRGIYMFRYVGEGHSVLQVLNASGTISYGMFVPTAIRRSGAVNDVAIWLLPPAAEGSPRRVHALFEPGASIGSEFVYQ